MVVEKGVTFLFLKRTAEEESAAAEGVGGGRGEERQRLAGASGPLKASDLDVRPGMERGRLWRLAAP